MFKSSGARDPAPLLLSRIVFWDLGVLAWAPVSRFWRTFVQLDQGVGGAMAFRNFTLCFWSSGFDFVALERLGAVP